MNDHKNLTMLELYMRENRQSNKELSEAFNKLRVDIAEIKAKVLTPNEMNKAVENILLTSEKVEKLVDKTIEDKFNRKALGAFFFLAGTTGFLGSKIPKIMELLFNK